MGFCSPTPHSGSRRSLYDFGVDKLIALTSAAGEPSEWSSLKAIFQSLVHPWGGQPVGGPQRYVSNVADDGAPFEFSIAISERGAEVQFYVDVQGEPPSARTNMQAGMAALRALALALHAPLDRLDRVGDLFFPEEPQPPFALWIGVSWSADQGIRLKVYLNPAARSPSEALDTVTRAMERLELGTAWRKVQTMLARGSNRRDEPAIVCLDLAKGDEARVKVYLRHHQATIGDVEAFADLTGEFEARDARTFYGIVAESDGPFLSKPLLTQIAFTSNCHERPAATTLTFPIGAYVENDAIAYARVQRCLAAFELPATAYQHAVNRFAARPLDIRRGLHAHVTLRRPKTGPRVGIYFASEAYPRSSHE
jgi:DMATS type aromatic prenyltransferase